MRRFVGTCGYRNEPFGVIGGGGGVVDALLEVGGGGVVTCTVPPEAEIFLLGAWRVILKQREFARA